MARPKKNVPTEATVIPEEPKNTTLTEEVPVKESIPEETAETAPTESAAPVKSAEENPSVEPEESVHTMDNVPDDGKTHIAISLPIEPFKKSFGSLERLRDLIKSKETLLKIALNTDSLEFEKDDEKVSFPWFTIADETKTSDELDAYTKLIVALARKAVTQSRVSSTEKLNPDTRLAMRLFLINLGFIGDEFKSARAILMRNFNVSNTSVNFAKDFPEALPIITVLKEQHHE